MATEVIVALITGGCAVLGQYMISLRNRQVEMTDRVRREAEEDARLKAIETRLDSHNAYAQKFEEVSRCMADMNIAIAKMKKDIEFLKARAEG